VERSTRLSPSLMYVVKITNFKLVPLRQKNSLTYLVLFQVNGSVLTKVIEWCEHHKNDPAPTADEETDSRKKSTDIEEWDQKFMQVDQEMLFEIILVRLFLFSVSPSSLQVYRKSLQPGTEPTDQLKVD